MCRRDAVGVMLIATLTPLTRAVAQSASNTAVEHYRRGSRAFLEQRFLTAIDELNRSLALDATQLAATRLLGLTYQLSGKLDDAEQRFAQAIQLSPKDAESWFYLGRVYYIRNFFDKALPALKRAVQYAPNDPRSHECLALTFEATSDTISAEREYQEAIRASVHPQGPSATPYLNYGAFLLKLDRLDESERLLQRAVDLMPMSWQAHFELGKLYYQTDRFDSALKEMLQAMSAMPTTEEAARTQALLSTVYFRLGREEDARRSAIAAEQ